MDIEYRYHDRGTGVTARFDDGRLFVALSDSVGHVLHVAVDGDGIQDLTTFLLPIASRVAQERMEAEGRLLADVEKSTRHKAFRIHERTKDGGTGKLLTIHRAECRISRQAPLAIPAMVLYKIVNTKHAWISFCHRCRPLEDETERIDAMTNVESALGEINEILNMIQAEYEEAMKDE